MAETTIRPRTYFLAYAALVALTFGTVSLSLLRLGEWHLAAGSAIGVVKVMLVALFFMHLVRSPPRTWLAAGLGLLWLGIMMALTMSDYLTRRDASF